MHKSLKIYTLIAEQNADKPCFRKNIGAVLTDAHTKTKYRHGKSECNKGGHGKDMKDSAGVLNSDKKTHGMSEGV